MENNNKPKETRFNFISFTILTILFALSITLFIHEQTYRKIERLTTKNVDTWKIISIYDSNNFEKKMIFQNQKTYETKEILETKENAKEFYEGQSLMIVFYKSKYGAICQDSYKIFNKG